jgi:nucleolar MIF4G domain-containing protein 1
LHVSERGRWWIVGSAFARNSVREVEATNDSGTNAGLSSKFDENLLALASKLQMNTDLRKEIFCTIMSSTVSLYFKLLMIYF